MVATLSRPDVSKKPQTTSRKPGEAPAGSARRWPTVLGIAGHQPSTFLTILPTSSNAVLQLVSERWSLESWHWIRDTQLREDVHRYKGNGPGAMGSLHSVALNFLRLSGLVSILSGMQAVMHVITALLAMVMRRSQLNPC